MKIIKYTLILVLFFTTISCEKELDIEPAQSISSEKALSTEDNVLNILVGTYTEAGEDATFGGRTQIIADLLGNTTQMSWGGTFVDPRQFNSKSVLVDNAFVEEVWGNSYEVINQANLVIDNLEVITNGAADIAEGEAKFLRALMYFDLVRHFGKPYVAGASNTQLGVPLRLNGIIDYGIDLSIARSTVEEVYTQIITDLNDAFSKLPATNDVYADKYAAEALLAKVYFQQGNYAAARDAADDVILYSGHTLAPTYSGAFNNDVDSVEDLFAFQVTSQGGDNDFITFYASQDFGGRQGDIDLQIGFFNLFDDAANDERYSFTYVSSDTGGTLTSKYTNQFANISVLRIADMHLVRAESNFREGTSVGLPPLDEVNAVRARSNASALIALTLDVLFNERQLELSFEGQLIHDIKRTQKNVGALSFDAEELILPIPQAEMDTNNLMFQNTGYVK
ncbi:RagB/SusD family nutrient uptake outer membrane protein [Polaribacter sp. Q13]|uniref:RagB/SusD family nutrient uptake outer membrane protein n=1 Tax=Polaribacter sp. Q13 TaxID=2806551 RepID=UPI00193C6100|nr:RagB/SusD family nutrient uptake outer membrane protein [Polaribacter sp. Q13]QVY65190.1 RagB/SusD family nutrient uptake outer membrane protein [Polaribacter sp. Q13]